MACLRTDAPPLMENRNGPAVSLRSEVALTLPNRNTMTPALHHLPQARKQASCCLIRGSTEG